MTCRPMPGQRIHARCAIIEDGRCINTFFWWLDLLISLASLSFFLCCYCLCKFSDKKKNKLLTLHVIIVCLFISLLQWNNASCTKSISINQIVIINSSSCSGRRNTTPSDNILRVVAALYNVYCPRRVEYPCLRGP